MRSIWRNMAKKDLLCVFLIDFVGHTVLKLPRPTRIVAGEETENALERLSHRS